VVIVRMKRIERMQKV